MSYLQRLLDAGPSISVTPGNVFSSPLAVQDQRLGEFPTIIDPFLPSPVQETDAPRPAVGPEQDTALPLEQSKDTGSETSPPKLSNVAPEPVRVRADTPPLDPMKTENTLEWSPEPPVRPKPEERLLNLREKPAEPDVTSTTVLSSHPRPETIDSLPQTVEPAAPSPGLWPISKADFQPLETPASVPPQERTPAADHPPAPLNPSVGIEPVQTPSVEQARTADGPLVPQPSVPPITPAVDTSPSPLTGVPEMMTLVPEPAASAPAPNAKPQVRTVERVVETVPKTDATPPAMTAASASVIGPISIGGMGLRERRARGWG
ncbi:MAG: hypothetical protein ABJL72_00710 [Roseobacter sp.]